MATDIARFFCIFAILMASFALGAEESVLSMLGLPTDPKACAITALIFTALIFRLNLWTAGTVCSLLMLANAGLPAAGILPNPEVCLALAATLACLPILKNMLDG